MQSLRGKGILARHGYLLYSSSYRSLTHLSLGISIARSGIMYRNRFLFETLYDDLLSLYVVCIWLALSRTHLDLGQ